MSLRHPLAPDDKMRAELDQVPRDISPARSPRPKRFPIVSEKELEYATRTLSDPETEIPGLLARIKLLELKVSKLMREMAQMRAK